MWVLIFPIFSIRFWGKLAFGVLKEGKYTLLLPCNVFIQVYFRAVNALLKYFEPSEEYYKTYPLLSTFVSLCRFGGFICVEIKYA